MCYKKFVSVSLAIGFFIIRHCEAWYKPWQSPSVIFKSNNGDWPLVFTACQLIKVYKNVCHMYKLL